MGIDAGYIAAKGHLGQIRTVSEGRIINRLDIVGDSGFGESTTTIEGKAADFSDATGNH